MKRVIGLLFGQGKDNPRSLQWMLIALLIGTSVTSLRADTPGSDELRQLSLEELMKTEVVSSTQQAVPLAETPSTSFVVTGDQLRRWGIRRLSELIERLVPGAITAEDFDDIILSFRGITADNNLKVLLLLNGHDYNTQWNNGPSSEAELGMMDDIKKVEVLIGPHSAVYGSGALIGVINIITKTGRDFSGIRVTGNFGSGDFKRGELIAGGESNPDLNYFFSMGGLSADGYDNNHNEPLNISRFPPSYRFYGNVNYKEFELMSRFTRSSRDFYIQNASATRPNFWTNYDTFFIDARRNFHVNDKLKCVFNFNYDTIQTQRHDFTLGTKLRAVGENRFSLKFTSFYSGPKNSDFVLGAYYRRDEFGSDWEGDNFNFSTTIVDGTVTGIPADPFTRRTLTPYGRNAYALFGQDSILLSDRYHLLFGFRYDRIEAPQIPKPDSFTPRVALVFRANDKTIFKTMFTSGLSRQPNAAVTSPDSFAFGAPVVTKFVNPERMYSYEAAASYLPNPGLNVSFNFFYNSFRDTFGLDPNSLPTLVLISAGRVDYVGFEAVANINVTGSTFVRFIQQHVQLGKVDDVLNILTTPDRKHPLDYPENVTKILADVRLNRYVSVNVNSNLIWNNFGFSAPTVTKESGFYSLTNANLVWDVNPKIQVVLSGYNLFNERQKVPPFALSAFLPERNFNMDLSYRF